jgi:ABC-2 type transport system permease protein
MLTGGTSAYGIATDCAVLVAISAVLLAIAARMYPRMTS